MATMSYKDHDGNWVTIEIELHGEIKVVNPGEPGWVDHSNTKEQVDNG